MYNLLSMCVCVCVCVSLHFDGTEVAAGINRASQTTIDGNTISYHICCWLLVLATNQKQASNVGHNAQANKQANKHKRPPKTN